MTVSLVTPDASCDQPSEVVTHDVMCLVKRHAYELAFAVPHSPHAPADEAQPRLHVRMKQPCRAGEIVLALEDVEQLGQPGGIHSGDVQIEGFIELHDPDKHILFAITNHAGRWELCHLHRSSHFAQSAGW